ncbi:Muscle calcium channel subunit alpha-1 (MDL-alpha-1) [Durusdinium trenchii]|uniref:Muscle calcium channel subunit alpha-1 (MDL-alpha-1) n=1 Tax=Durusdinium trenchii TaxID=1381693 RepID=A0ABP0JGD2_9DINO
MPVAARLGVELSGLGSGGAATLQRLGEADVVVREQRKGTTPCDRGDGVLVRTPMKSVRAIMRGRETTGFQRTQKFLRSPEEELNSLLHSFSFLLLDGSAVDLEVPHSAGGMKVRTNLIAWFSRHAEVQVVSELPEEAYGSAPRGWVAAVHRLMSSQASAFVVYSCIMISVVIMALSSPLLDLDPVLASEYRREVEIMEILEAVVTWVFTVELVLRVVGLESLAFFLRDPWNLLDFTVVVFGWLTKLMSRDNGDVDLGDAGPQEGLNLTAFRALRALRVLRTFKMLEGIREIVDTFVRTLGTVSQGVMLVFYILTLAAVAATDLWSESLRFQCVDNASQGELAPSLFCDADELKCPEGSTCTRIDLSKTSVGFWSFSSSLLTLYQVATRAGIGSHVHPLLQTSETAPQEVAVVFFFVLFNLFVSGMVLAIFVAIIRSTFTTTRRQTLELKAQQNAKQTLLAHQNSGRRYSSRSGSRVAPLDGSLQESDLQEEEKDPIPPVRKGLLEGFVESPGFESLVSLAIAINCAFLALAHHEQSQEWADMLRRSELAFTLIFLAEMILKMVGLRGIRRYFASVRNCFDFVIVLSSLVDVFASSFVNLSLLRLLRLLRLVRLLRTSPDIMRIISALRQSIPQMTNLILFCVLLLSVFSILGMQLYGATMGFPASIAVSGVESDEVNWSALLASGNVTLDQVYSPPRGNFDTFSRSMLTLFLVMTGGAQWPIVHGLLKTEANATVPVFFLTFGVFANFIIVNFMVVIIMSNFAMTPEELQRMRDDRDKRSIEALKKEERLRRVSLALAEMDREESLRNLSIRSLTCRDFGLQAEEQEESTSASEAWTPPSTSPKDNPLAQAAGNFEWVSAFISEERQTFSLGLISPFNTVRMRLYYWSDHKAFEAAIIGAIVGSSVFLTLESPSLSQNDALQRTMEIADTFFLVVFTVEFVIKVSALGLMLPKYAYLKNAWNRLDFAVLVVSYLSISGVGGSAGRMLRIGRILRPLRMINRNDGLRVIVDALLRALRPVSYTLMLLAVYFFGFGIIGMEFFMGLFWRCNDPSVVSRAECVGNFVSSRGVLQPRVWRNQPFSFDSIGESLCTLFETVALKGWPEKLYAAVDATELDMQPRTFASPWNALYFVMFVYFGSFFMMKLFVGVIVGTFRRYSGTLLLTPSQLQWIEMKHIMSQIQPRCDRSAGRLRLACFELVHHPVFETLVVVVTLVHIVLIVLHQAAHLSDASAWKVYWVMGVFHWISFIVESFSHGLRGTFFRLRFNAKTMRQFHVLRIFKVFEVATLLAFLFMPAISAALVHVPPIMRAVDFSRIVKCVRHFSPRLRQILVVLSECILAMFNVTLVFFMVLFIYAVLGMQLFASVREGNVIGVHASFASFPEAILTVFQIAAGDNWILIMRDCAREEPHCVADEDCGSLMLARAYFYSFYFWCFGVFINLYVATIVDSYESKNKTLSYRWTFSEDQFVHYQSVWQDFDPQGTGRISTKLFRPLFFALGNPFAQDRPALTHKQHNHQYNQARFEIYRHITSDGRCALPRGGVALPQDHEPSVSFFQVLGVAIMVNVDQSALSIPERAERLRKDMVISKNLAAMTLQSLFRGVLHRQVFRAMILASKSNPSSTSLLDMNSRESKALIQSAYAKLYNSPMNEASLAGLLDSRIAGHTQDIAFANLHAAAQPVENKTQR